MNKTTISYKSKNILIDKLIKQSNIKVLKEKSFLSKFFSKKEFPDVYFHTGILDDKSKQNIKNSKIIIVNSFSTKKDVLDKVEILNEKIEVIYPSINLKNQNIEEIKTKIFEELKIDLEDKVIFFTAKNFKTSGVKEFLDICIDLNYEKFKIIIVGTNQQINSLKFQLNKYNNLQEKLILLEDYKNIDEIFISSDVFVLPTYNKSFSSNILKAMFYENVVFVTSQNDAKEVVDVFATMNNPSDSTTAFKIDAILNSQNDLELIKKQNRDLAQEFTLESNLQKINSIIENV
jgi:glycosyltransferase involved in cell wall biosynthesis